MIIPPNQISGEVDRPPDESSRSVEDHLIIFELTVHNTDLPRIRLGLDCDCQIYWPSCDLLHPEAYQRLKFGGGLVGFACVYSLVGKSDNLLLEREFRRL